jgi:hypothetical protein
MQMNIKMSVFKPVFMDQRIALTPMEFREAAADIDAFLLAKMKKGLEGQCCIHGYVREGSMQIMARSMGQAEHGRFTGDFLYFCKIRVDCLALHEGQLVEGQVLKVYKMGAYALLTEGGEVLEAARVLLPREFHIGHVEFDSLAPGAHIRMKVLRSRFQKSDAFIQAAGVMESVLGSSVSGVKPLLPAIPNTETV